MKKTKFWIGLVAGSVAALSCVLVAKAGVFDANLALNQKLGASKSIGLTLTKSNRLTTAEPTSAVSSATARTNLGNGITFNYSNVTSPENSDNFQKIVAGGYIENTSPITGLSGVHVNVSGSGKVDVFSARKLENNAFKTYEYVTTLDAAGSEATFSTISPYVKLLAQSNVEIISVDFGYICSGVEEKCPVVTPKELTPGQQVKITFDDYSLFNLENVNTPYSRIVETDDDLDMAKTGNKALYFESNGGFAGINLHNMVKFNSAYSYSISAKYRYVSGGDTVYFQFRSSGISDVFKQLSKTNTLKTVNLSVSPTNNTGIIQMFPGANTSAKTVCLLDDLTIKCNQPEINVTPATLSGVLETNEYALETFGDELNKIVGFTNSSTSYYLSSIGGITNESLFVEASSSGEIKLNLEDRYTNLLNEGYYTVEFDYMMLDGSGALSFKFYNSATSSVTVSLNNTLDKTVKHASFKVVSYPDDGIIGFALTGGSNNAFVLDNLKITKLVDEDNSVYKENLESIGDYVLETFSSAINVKRNLDADITTDSTGATSLVEYVGHKLDGDALHVETIKNGSGAYVAYAGSVFCGSNKFSAPFNATNGTYRIEFDYLTEAWDSGAVYLKLLATDNSSGISLYLSKDVGTRLHYSEDVLLTGKLWKIQVFGGSATHLSIYFDNFKITRVGGDEVTANTTANMTSVGDYVFENFNTNYYYGTSTKNRSNFRTYSATKATPQFEVTFEDYNNLGYVLHYVANSSAVIYEGIYLKPSADVVIGAGSYKLTFDYAAFAAKTVGTMYISAWDTSTSGGTICSNETQINVKSDVGTIKHFSLDINPKANLKFIRIMSSSAGAADFIIDNLKIEKTA